MKLHRYIDHYAVIFIAKFKYRSGFHWVRKIPTDGQKQIGRHFGDRGVSADSELQSFIHDFSVGWEE